MTHYALGFIFRREEGQLVDVLLERKQRPSWQAGKLNGVGGKVEKGESYLDTMRRECKEETLLEIDDWVSYGTVNGPDFCICLFYTVVDEFKLPKRSPDEPLVIMDLENVSAYRDAFVNHTPACIMAALAHHNTNNFSMFLEFSVLDEKTLDKSVKA